MLTVTSQHDQSSGEEFELELACEDEMDDASSQTGQPQPQIMDPLFHPAPSVHTKDTRDTNKSSRAIAFDVNYFFVLVTIAEKTGERKKRACKLCG